MASKIKVDQIEGSTGSSITIPSGQTLTIADGLSASTIGSGTLSSDRLPTVPVAKGGTGVTSLGTANQVLAVNSGASALEFQDASGGAMEKLSVVNFSSVNTLSINGLSTYFGSTPSNYSYYKLICEFTSLTGSAALALGMRINISGSASTSGRYNWNISRTQSNNTSLVINNGEADNYFKLNGDGIRDTNDYSHWMELNIFNLNDNSSQYKYLQYFGRHSWAQHDSDCRVHGNVIMGNYNTSTSDNQNKTGLTFFPASGNFSGNIYIYGAKK